MQYGNWYDNPAFGGFPGDGYWLMSEEELLGRYPVEYLNNTQLIVDKCEGNIVKFGDTIPPRFNVPQWFIDEVNSTRTDVQERIEPPKGFGVNDEKLPDYDINQWRNPDGTYKEDQ